MALSEHGGYQHFPHNNACRPYLQSQSTQSSIFGHLDSNWGNQSSAGGLGWLGCSLYTARKPRKCITTSSSWPRVGRGQMMLLDGAFSVYPNLRPPWDFWAVFGQPQLGVRKDFEPLKGSPAYKYFCIYTFIRCDPLPNSAFVEMHGHLEKMGSAWDISQSFVSMPPVFKGKATSRSTHFCEGGSTTNQMISSA